MLGYLLAVAAIWGAANGKAGITLTILALSTVLLLLHELGHAFVARRFGLQVEDIILWPLGGMARIREMPESPRVEAWVAAAGPAVNLILAVAALPVVLFASSEPTGALALMGLEIPIRSGFEGFATHFVVINLGYGLFNLIPAFPMDGGRLLRAFLGRGGRDWVKATDQATRVGAVFAWATIVMSALGGACFIGLIGLFVLWAGLRERWVVRLRHQAEAMGGGAGRFAGWEHLMRQRGPFGGNAGGGDAGTGFGGFGGNTSGPFGGGPTVDVESRDATPADDLPRVGGGFSEDDIAELESFRGRLRKPKQDEE